MTARIQATLRVISVLTFFFIGLPAKSQTTVDLVVPGAGEDLVSSLGRALGTNEVIADGAYSAQDIVAAAQADYRRVVSALYEDGYYGPDVSIRLDGREAASVSAFDAVGRISKVTVTIDPGQKFLFGSTRIAPMPSEVAKPAQFETGQTARLSSIRSAAQDGITAWRAQGHARASVARQQITADHATARIDVDLGLLPGPRLTFGSLNTNGLTRLRPERAQEIAGLPVGTVFDPDEVDRAATRLRRTGVFNVVSLTEADEIGSGNVLGINAELSERKPRRFGFGAEFDTVDGGTVSAFWLHRNLFGGAERLRIESEISGIDSTVDGLDYSIGATLSRPATFGPDTDLTTSVELSVVDDPAYTSDRFDIEVGLLRRVTDQFEYSFGIGFIRSRTTDVFGTRNFRMLTFPLEATLDKRDNALNATTGYYLNATATPYVGLAGTESGARLTADARAYRGFGTDDRFVLAGRLQLGSLIGPEIADAPSDFLFLSGGGGTVRGQSYQSLGVTQTSGLSGGRSFLGLSTELRAKTSDKLSVVGFYDAGFIGAESIPGQNSDWHSGVGLGVRYDTGLGPIRLDVATPATGSNAWERVEFYIGLGQAF